MGNNLNVKVVKIYLSTSEIDRPHRNRQKVFECFKNQNFQLSIMVWFINWNVEITIQRTFQKHDLHNKILIRDCILWMFIQENNQSWFFFKFVFSFSKQISKNFIYYIFYVILINKNTKERKSCLI